MRPETATTSQSDRKAYIVTGPTSGIGRATAFELAKHGTVILVGRDTGKLHKVEEAIEEQGGNAVAVVCDISDIAAVQKTAAQIVDLHLPLAGLVNNAGIHQTSPTKSAQGWDMTFATDHLGPFAFTESLVPYLPEGANVVFIASGAEDPERKPAKVAGSVAAVTSPRKRALAASGGRADRNLQAQMPTRPPSSARSPLRLSSLASIPAFTSTQWNRASTLPHLSGERPTHLFAFF